MGCIYNHFTCVGWGGYYPHPTHAHYFFDCKVDVLWLDVAGGEGGTPMCDGGNRMFPFGSGGTGNGVYGSWIKQYLSSLPFVVLVFLAKAHIGWMTYRYTNNARKGRHIAVPSNSGPRWIDTNRKLDKILRWASSGFDDAIAYAEHPRFNIVPCVASIGGMTGA